MQAGVKDVILKNFLLLVLLLDNTVRDLKIRLPAAAPPLFDSSQPDDLKSSQQVFFEGFTSLGFRVGVFDS